MLYGVLIYYKELFIEKKKLFEFINSYLSYEFKFFEKF